MSDWIEWNGGECDIPDGTAIEVRYRNGLQMTLVMGLLVRNNKSWTHGDPAASDSDIIAYRIIKQEREAKPFYEHDEIEWSMHTGKRRPADIKPDDIVDILLSNSVVVNGVKASDWKWGSDSFGFGTAAYRRSVKNDGLFLRMKEDASPEISWSQLDPAAKQLAHAVKKRDKHRAKLDKWSGEVERLKGELEREIEEATGMPCRIGDDNASGDQENPDLMKCKFDGGSLWDKVGVPSGSTMHVSDDESGNVWQHHNGDTSPVEIINVVGEPIKGTVTWPIPEGVDPDDPATWKAGDVVECVDGSECFTLGNEYVFSGELENNNLPVMDCDDMGDTFASYRAKFRFVRRPS